MLLLLVSEFVIVFSKILDSNYLKFKYEQFLENELLQNLRFKHIKKMSLLNYMEVIILESKNYYKIRKKPKRRLHKWERLKFEINNFKKYFNLLVIKTN